MLDTLYRRFTGCSGNDGPAGPRVQGRNAALTSARIFVLDESAQDPILTPRTEPNRNEGPSVKRTILALGRIQNRLENELDATTGSTERDAGYRAGISEAIVQVMDIRQDFSSTR
ncbi:hypothetical protein [Rhodococcus gannanensis]|uniref:Uncharacterized protein n=1 Tax=Rhodococcus gannanensis TaxID=1960308 RepID=A0ABW4NY49_9NOCA